MHYIEHIDALNGIYYTVGDKMYPGDIYFKAYEAANHDPRLKDEIESLEEKYIQKWCEYYTFEQRQNKEKRIENAIKQFSEKTTPSVW